MRGPGAVLYGDYAYQGVLNILTRKGTTRAFARVDEHGTTTPGGQFAYRSEDGDTGFDLNVAGSKGDSVEAPAGVDARNDQRSGIANFTHRGFQFTAQAMRRNYHSDANALGFNLHESTTAFEARQTMDLAAKTTATLYTSYLDNDYSERIQRFLGHTWEGGAELSWQGMDRHHWLAQFTYADSRIEEAFLAPPASPGSRPVPAVDKRDVNRRHYGISLQDQYEVSDRLSLTAGLRFDRRIDLDLKLFTPRLAAVWRLADAHILKAQYSEGYRAPTFWELYPRNVKNDLEPETIATTELSYINRVADRVVRLTLFHSRLENHISPLGAPTFNFENNGSSRAVGVELEWEQQWSPKLKSWLNLSYSDSRDGRVLPRNETGDQDPTTSDWLANLALFYRPTDRVLLTAHWNYVGKRHSDSIDTKAENRVNVTLNLFDVWTKGLTLRLGVRNLFQADQRSLLGIPSGTLSADFPERLVWGQVVYDF